ncbi:PAS domain-containing protein [Streptomyces solisilvae]|uniref:helix-turn-helix transcriptional regulator n=1 Tax=Streptomyces malaysiensis TaxID=92644 RepID=UPI00332479AE
MVADRVRQAVTGEPFVQCRATPDGERAIAVVASLIEPLGITLPPSSEIILHDLSRLPNSIVAVYGNVTGRRVGDPATTYLLERAAAGRLRDDLGYETRLDDGRTLRSSTMIIRDVSGDLVAALCVNVDISVWLQVQQIASTMTFTQAKLAVKSLTPPGRVNGGHDPRSRERFPRDVDELANYLIDDAIRCTGVDVVKMKKKHKIQVVGLLQSKRIFLIKNSVEKVADALGVTRFTIYNYLNELSDGIQNGPQGQ